LLIKPRFSARSVITGLKSDEYSGHMYYTTMALYLALLVYLMSYQQNVPVCFPQKEPFGALASFLKGFLIQKRLTIIIHTFLLYLNLFLHF